MATVIHLLMNAVFNDDGVLFDLDCSPTLSGVSMRNLTTRPPGRNATARASVVMVDLLQNGREHGRWDHVTRDLDQLLLVRCGAAWAECLVAAASLEPVVT